VRRPPYAGESVPPCPRTSNSDPSASTRRSSSRRWRASPTRPTAGCASSRCRLGPRVGPLRLRDDHQRAAWSRATRPRSRCWSSTSWRRRAVGPALWHRPGLCRQGGRDPLCRVRRRPRRPQLRLPGPQGHPQGRREGRLPWKRGLLAEILARGVTAATPYDVPVTMKTRKGIDDDHLTYLDAGRIAQESGCRRDRAARPHGRAGLLRHRPTGTRSRRWSRTSISPCWATAISGRPPTPCSG
jgi:hypothetical protein